MKKDIFWNSLGTSAWAFLSPLLLIIVTRVNGLADSGVFSFAFALALVMFTIACYGGRTYQVSDQHKLFSTNGYISQRIVTTIAVAIIATLFIIANGYDTRKSIIILLLVGQRIVDAISDVFYGILQKNNLLHIAGKSLFYKSLLSLAAFFALDMFSKNLALASLCLPVVSLAFLVAYDIPQSRKSEHFAFRIRSTETIQLLQATFLPFVIAASSLLFANVARYFIDIYHPSLQGYFGIIVMPLSLITLLFSFIFVPAILPLSTMYNNGEFQNLNTAVRKIVGIVLGLTLTLAALTYFLGAPVLRVLFGLNFEAFRVELTLIVAVGAALSLGSLFTQIAIIARKLRTVAVVALASTLVLIALGLALTEPYEIRGAILAYVVASFTQMLVLGVYFLHLVRITGLPRTDESAHSDDEH